MGTAEDPGGIFGLILFVVFSVILLGPIAIDAWELQRDVRKKLREDKIKASRASTKG